MFIEEFKACMRSESHLSDCIQPRLVLWSVFQGFPKLDSSPGILLHRRAIGFGNSFQLISLFFWSYLDRLIGVFSTGFDLSTLHVFKKVLFKSFSFDFCCLFKKMAFSLLFILMYLMISGGVDHLEEMIKRKEGQRLTKLCQCFLNEKKNISFDSFTIQNPIHD